MRKPKIIRHEPNRRSWAPRVGARTGATPTTSMRRAIALDTAMPSKLSRRIAIDRTMPAAALKPWTNRRAVNSSMESATTSAAEVST